MDKQIIIGSRESKLAVVQSNQVIEYINNSCPEAEVTLLTMKTTGDKILDRGLNQIGGKGLFVKELETALRNRKCDYAVHSLKDMPMDMPEDLPLICFSKREDPRDVMVLPAGQNEIDFSKPIGTSSLRRILQLKKLYPEARFESVRGNLQTRLNKLDSGQYGAIVLAAAGLKRLGLEDRISRYYSTGEVIPAAGQGILAVQGRAGEDNSIFADYGDETINYIASAERAFVKALDGGCVSPIAAHAVVEDGRLRLTGLYAKEDSDKSYYGSRTGDCKDAESIGRELAAELLKKSMEERN